MTFEELELMFSGYHKRREIEMNDILSLAWYSAAFERQKKLPKLENLLKKDKTTNKKPSVLSNEEKLKLLKNKGLELPKGVSL